ncbi:MAG: hypothetical protein QOD29_2729 [Alphaproteobacteria bacterium]|jgi:hypothetical protein|nr:hypothetical protein [Alphaproteobacteria bacterium]
MAPRLVAHKLPGNEPNEARNRYDAKKSIAHAIPAPLNSRLNRPRLKVVVSTAIRRHALISVQFMGYAF